MLTENFFFLIIFAVLLLLQQLLQFSIAVCAFFFVLLSRFNFIRVLVGFFSSSLYPILCLTVGRLFVTFLLSAEFRSLKLKIRRSAKRMYK